MKKGRETMDTAPEMRLKYIKVARWPQEFKICLRGKKEQFFFAVPENQTESMEPNGSQISGSIKGSIAQQGNGLPWKQCIPSLFPTDF